LTKRVFRPEEVSRKGAILKGNKFNFLKRSSKVLKKEQINGNYLFNNLQVRSNDHAASAWEICLAIILDLEVDNFTWIKRAW
jgi:hypothetical protein